MVRADTASSLVPVLTAATPGVLLTCSSSAIPSEMILSRRSMMMRWAVFKPIPLTLFRMRSSPLAMMLHSSDGVSDDRIIRAVLAPTPLTVISNWYRERSCLLMNPYKVKESSRPPVTNTSWTKSLTGVPLPSLFIFVRKASYVLSEMLSAYPTPPASMTASAGVRSASSPLMYSIMSVLFVYIRLN